MKQKILLVLIAISFLAANSCKDDIVGPQPGRRDYVWTTDTIKAPFFFANKIWGTSAEDLWIIGPGGGLDKTIWRYTGSKWQSDGISRAISPLSICGFSKNNVWIAGREGRIWHYDGLELKENVMFKKNNWDIGFQEIWGDSPNEIYATGYADSGNFRHGIILRYYENKWSEVYIQAYPYNFLRIRRGLKESTKFYLYGIYSSTSEGSFDGLFEFDGTHLRQIYKAMVTPQTWAFLQKIDDKILFVIGNKIYRYVDNQFMTITQITNPYFGLQIFGRNEKDIFLRMEDGIAHYNGNDIEYLYKFQSKISIVDGIVFEKDVFFLGRDYNLGINVVLKGKIN